MKIQTNSDIHPSFRWNSYDSWVCSEIVKFKTSKEEAQLRLLFFKKHSELLSDYCYWYMLSTLWVEYTGFTSLGLWRELFSSNRPDRECLMKPSEIEYFNSLPEDITAFRAHRKKEKDFISYTIKKEVAERFLVKRPEGFIKEYSLKKKDVLCIFLRRQEFEIIVLNKKEKEK